MTRDACRATLAAVVAFAPGPRPRERDLMHGWLDTWHGIGGGVAGIAREDDDVQPTRYDGRDWRATLYTTGRARGGVGRPQLP